MNKTSENELAKPASLSIAIVGSGGSGVMTAGSLLLEAAGHAGLYGIMTRSSGPQIRGGEGAALLRFSTNPVFCHSGHFDLLLAIDWLNADRFAAEITLDENSHIIGDEAIPEVFSQSGASVREISFKQLAAQSPGLRPNMIALGLIGSAIGLPSSGQSCGTIVGCIQCQSARWVRSDCKQPEAPLGGLARTVEHQWQRSCGTGCYQGRDQVCGGLPDHTGNGNPGMVGAFA